MEHIATLAIIWTRCVCSSFIHCLCLLPNLCLMNVNRGLCAISVVTVGVFSETDYQSGPVDSLQKLSMHCEAPLATGDQYGLCLCSCYGLIRIDCHISQLHSFLRCLHNTACWYRGDVVMAGAEIVLGRYRSSSAMISVSTVEGKGKI